MDNNLKILNYLGKHKGREYSMHELSKELKIPYASFYRTIQKMEDLLTIKMIGKSKVLQLNFKNPILKAHLAISSEEEKKEFLVKKSIIKKISSELETQSIVALFGSYAKGKETPKSDIDLLVINPKGERDVFFGKYETIFKKKINPIYISEKEFKLMLKDQEENVGKQALKDHIILNNSEYFWECVLNVF